MGPADFLAMWEGYKWRDDKRRKERQTELYLWRQIAAYTHNALADKPHKAKKPSDILPIPEIDHPRGEQEQREEQKKKLRTALDNA